MATVKLAGCSVLLCFFFDWKGWGCGLQQSESLNAMLLLLLSLCNQPLLVFVCLSDTHKYIVICHENQQLSHLCDIKNCNNVKVGKNNHIKSFNEVYYAAEHLEKMFWDLKKDLSSRLTTIGKE
jgi:hypothetical protein